MTKNYLLFPRTALLLACAASASVLLASGPAETTAPVTIMQPSTSTAAPGMFDIDEAISPLNNNFRYKSEGFSSSSEPEAVLDERASLSSDFNIVQPPTRRRSYGRSRYQDKMHNADGSNKIAIVAGAGLNLPVGNTGKYYTPSYTLTAGGGYNFNKTFGVLGEFHYDHMGVTGGAINYQYNNYLATGVDPTLLAGFDANAHVIALTVNPIVNYSGKGKVGAYVTGGVGFYRKTTNFTLPQAVVDYFGNLAGYQNQTFDSYSANSFGTNLGVGFTYKLSEFSSERLFAEARYDWLKINNNNNADLFPFNRRNSEYVPITVGIRF